MQDTLNSHTRACLACLLFLLIPALCPAETDEATAPPPPELPQPVWRALLDSGGGTAILRADFQQTYGLPELALYVEEKKNLRGTQLPIVGDLIAAAPALGPVSDSISDLWRAGGSGSLFAKTDLGRDEIIASYRSYGWTLFEGEDPSSGGTGHLRQPLDEADEEIIRRSLEEFRRNLEFEEMETAELRSAAEAGDEQAQQMLEYQSAADEQAPDLEEMEREFRSDQMNRKWRVVPGEKGWISLIRPWGNPADFSLQQPSNEEMVHFKEFPLGALLEEPIEDLFLIAMVFPNREDDNQEPGSEEDTEQDPRRAELERELNELNKEYRGLSGDRGDDVLNRIGNMLLRINEIDGGIDLDLVAEISGDPGESFTTEVVQMGLGFLRMAVISQSPELARELLDTTVSISNDQVRARANISHATLMDFLHRSADKERRLREIRKRMEELQRELEALYQAE